MESSSLVGGSVSPESTVTSLLSSSGHLRSILVAPEHTTTIRYKHRLYDSASAALNAYISDFNSSHLKETALTGNLNVSRHVPPALSRPRATALRNKDVLREHLTDRELDFLSLPDSSLHHSVNPDRVSMTTDELLSIPYDGSMPVTHTSAFIQGLLSQSRVTPPFPSSRPADRTRSHIPGLSQHPPATRSFRRRPAAAALKPQSAHVGARSDGMEPSSSLHLPHWLTSHKSDVDGSDASVLNLEYPPWIQCCDLSEPPAAPDWDQHDAASRPEAPSWVEDLEEDEAEEHTLFQVDSQQTLRNLRLQLAEQISVLAAERANSSARETLFRDHRMEALIQKADRLLSALAEGRGAAERPDAAESSTPEDVAPANTQELLRRHRDSLESSAGGATTPPPDRDVQAPTCYSRHGNSVAEQPGPAEALKQVLFRLQAVEAELQHHQHDQQQQQQQQQLKPPAVPLQQEVEPEPGRSPDGLSLHRALHHLTQLKALVEEPRKKPGRSEEEKDEDEGRYSSSSTDGCACAEQNSS